MSLPKGICDCGICFDVDIVLFEKPTCKICKREITTNGAFVL